MKKKSFIALNSQHCLSNTKKKLVQKIVVISITFLCERNIKNVNNSVESLKNALGNIGRKKN